MIIDAFDSITGQPVRINATQVVVYNDQETPIVVAGEYGPRGAQKVAHAGDEDFNQALRLFGVGRHRVETTSLKTT